MLEQKEDAWGKGPTSTPTKAASYPPLVRLKTAEG
jgi:hypothetical protein